MSLESEYTIALDLDPAREAAEAIRGGLAAFNEQQGAPEDFVPLNLTLRDAEGALAGGLLGGTLWGWLHVNILWLADAARRQGYGTQLLAQAELEARRRGCVGAFLDTMSWQARPFYEKYGYTVFAEMPDCPPGHTRYFMKREFT